ncbi:MAG: NYN domain-containing protein [Planctomycetota bacterium]
MRALIDGHNALGALRIREKTHEAARHALLRRVAAKAPHATVFFDAREAPRDLAESRCELGVEVYYCRRREADQAILDEVREADDARGLIVVTNDREVAGRAAQLGAQVVGVTEFLGAADARVETGEVRRLPQIHPRLTPQDFGLPDEVDLNDPDFD